MRGAECVLFLSTDQRGAQIDIHFSHTFSFYILSRSKGREEPEDMKEWESAREIKGKWSGRKKTSRCLSARLLCASQSYSSSTFSRSLLFSGGWGGAELLKRQPLQQEAINQTKYPRERGRRRGVRNEKVGMCKSGKVGRG